MNIVLMAKLQRVIREPEKTQYRALSSEKTQSMKMHMSKKDVLILEEEKSQERKVENEKFEAQMLFPLMSRFSKSPPMIDTSLTVVLELSVFLSDSSMISLSLLPE